MKALVRRDAKMANTGHQCAEMGDRKLHLESFSTSRVSHGDVGKEETWKTGLKRTRRKGWCGRSGWRAHSCQGNAQSGLTLLALEFQAKLNSELKP